MDFLVKLLNLFLKVLEIELLIAIDESFELFFKEGEILFKMVYLLGVEFFMLEDVVLALCQRFLEFWYDFGGVFKLGKLFEFVEIVSMG
jgi:hypothetical protein